MLAGPKTQEEVALKKTEKKSSNKNQVNQPERSTKQTAPAINTLDKNVQSSSTPKNKQTKSQIEEDRFDYQTNKEQGAKTLWGLSETF